MAPLVDGFYRARNGLDVALAIYAAAVKHRPLGRYTIRQRCRVLERWPNLNAD